MNVPAIMGFATTRRCSPEGDVSASAPHDYCTCSIGAKSADERLQRFVMTAISDDLARESSGAKTITNPRNAAVHAEAET